MSQLHFTVPPFTREIKIEQRFRQDFLEAEIEALHKVTDERQSAVLVAPAGSGKTVVLRALKASLPEARNAVFYIKLADLSARDMCRQVALALGLEPAGNFPALSRALEARLRSGYEEHGLRQILIFDDAHDMRPEALATLARNRVQTPWRSIGVGQGLPAAPAVGNRIFQQAAPLPPRAP